MKRTGVMAMIEEEIYVPQGTDHTMVEKMHTQNYGYNDFYAKPVVRGGRAASGSSLTPQEGFIIKHYAGPVPYKVRDVQSIELSFRMDLHAAPTRRTCACRK